MFILVGLDRALVYTPPGARVEYRSFFFFSFSKAKDSPHRNFLCKRSLHKYVQVSKQASGKTMFKSRVLKLIRSSGAASEYAIQ